MITEPYKAQELFMNTHTVSRRSSSSVAVIVTDTQAYYWRACEASEILSGVTQMKIGDICLFMCGRTYVILHFDPRVFLCSLRVRPCPKLN